MIRNSFALFLFLFLLAPVRAQRNDSIPFQFVNPSFSLKKLDDHKAGKQAKKSGQGAKEIPDFYTRKNTEDTLYFVFRPKDNAVLRFRIKDSLLTQNYFRTAGDTFALILAPALWDYPIGVWKDEQLIARLNVHVYKRMHADVLIVPTLSMKLDKDSLNAWLNEVFAPANISFKVVVKPFFQSEYGEDLLSNPSPQHDRFTEQMTIIRDAYFEKHPPESAYYIFLTEGFVNPEIEGYAVRNKAVAFVKGEQENLYRTIARQLGFACGALEASWWNGPPKGSTQNLMDAGEGTALDFAQWELLRKNINSIFYYDEYENVRSNNGMIAYYFWQEDENGNLVAINGSFNRSILHPFKRNQYSLHLDIDNWLFYPLFPLGVYEVCALHLIVFVLLFILSAWVRRKGVAWLMRKVRLWRIVRFGLRILVFGSAMGLYALLFLLIQSGYMLFEVKEGQLEYLRGSDLKRVENTLRNNVNTARLAENEMGSEIVVQRGDNWYIERHKPVLYFDVYQKDGQWTACRFKTSSVQLNLPTRKYSKKAESHYYVFRYILENDSCAMEKVFNHAGSEITDKLTLEDPARRILLLVNGYRPTSLGQTFEENFADVQKHGLEYPNSNNLIYSFDRYQYWEPWNQMNELFKKRVNAEAVYYADGHFSVETSNHRSLINFTTLSTSYPHRCDKGKHICRKSPQKNWYFFNSDTKIPTAQLLNTDPNYEGFNERRENGRIAGRNLRTMLNELPNGSQNDTLYLVAHSMGYAYALGIIEELRGHIAFGGLYIIAPENASAGKVRMNEWEEIWQYGADHVRYAVKAPCLLDGIAPQVRAGGLSASNRIFIPDRYYKRMGFYDSHFIGHYNWIFTIPEEGAGYIRQR
jgi:hypothetical protein